MMHRKQPASCYKSALPEILLFSFAVLSFLAALLLPLLSLAQGLSPDEKRLMEAYQNGEIVRLHILAHSDSPEDQQIKLLVRNAVLEHFGELARQKQPQSQKEVLRFLNTHLEEIRKTAESSAKAAGFTGSVKAELGLMHLPQKQYGQVTLPAGEYQGLRITLGSGQGQNWWCILFPQLCLEMLTENASTPNTDENPVFPSVFFDSLRILQRWTLLPPCVTSIIPNAKQPSQH